MPGAALWRDGCRAPPTLFIEVGFGWVSKLNEEDEGWGEDQFAQMINIPAGYRPTWAKVGWSGLRGKTENREFNFAFAIGGKSQGIEHETVTYDGVVLQMPATADWPQGVPISGRVHGAWDGAMYVQATLSCMRTAEALNAKDLADLQLIIEAAVWATTYDFTPRIRRRNLNSDDPKVRPYWVESKAPAPLPDSLWEKLLQRYTDPDEGKSFKDVGPLGAIGHQGRAPASSADKWSPALRLSHYFSQVLYPQIKKENGAIIQRFNTLRFK